MTLRRVPPRFALPAGMMLAALAVAAWGQGPTLAGGGPAYAPSGFTEARRDSVLARLRAWETAQRRRTDFTNHPPGDRALGPDPFRIASLPGSDRLVVLLRGSSEIAVLGPDLQIRQRLPAPASPTGMAISGEYVFVGGELGPELAAYRIEPGGTLTADRSILVGAARGIRDMAAGPRNLLYVVDEVTNRLISLRPARGESGWEAAEPHWVDTGRGPIRVRAAKGLVAVNALLDHRVILYPTNAEGIPDPRSARHVEHDGPLWSFDLAAGDDFVLLAAGGVEDHPLDRGGGFFGFVDSFLFTYRVGLGHSRDGRIHLSEPVRLAALNISQHGVITPKCVRIENAEGELAVSAWGYGGWNGLRAEWTGDLRGDPGVFAHPTPAGITDVADGAGDRRVGVSPLLDGALFLPPDLTRPEEPAPLVRYRAGVHYPELLLGEVLFFTGLMGPAATSEGAHSRFTCETCHFEGYGDGRVHYTGRGDVHAATKPLRGLFNNKPHFSRALDDDLTEMVNNEFRVACAETGLDPWFTLAPANYPGLAESGLGDPVPPGELRRALMRFLMWFTFAPNPLAAGQSRWTPRQAEGAAVFSRRCEGCHQARLVADDPSTRVGADGWERLTLSTQGPLVWARGEYQKTGVTPYVHAEGARVPSLRRLYKKFPYFTNGSASDLREVLDRVRYDDSRFFHDGAPLDHDLRSLTGEEREALLEFLRLL